MCSNLINGDVIVSQTAVLTVYEKEHSNNVLKLENKNKNTRQRKVNPTLHSF